MNKILAIIAAGVLAASLTASCASDSDTDRAEELQTEYVEAFLGADLDAHLALVADDVVFDNPTTGDHRETKAQFETLLTWVYTVTDYDQTEIMRRFVSDDGGFGVVEVHWVGTRTDSGEPFDLDMVQVHEYDDGEIASVSVSYANPDARDQLMG